MTKDEALQAMRDGKKVRHRSFTPSEWMKLEGWKYRTEDGCLHDPDVFWKYRRDPVWETDWEVVE